MRDRAAIRTPEGTIEVQSSTQKARAVQPPLLHVATEDGRRAVLRSRTQVLWIGRRPSASHAGDRVDDDDPIVLLDLPSMPRRAAAVEHSRAHGCFRLVSFVESPRTIEVDGVALADRGDALLDRMGTYDVVLTYPAGDAGYRVALRVELRAARSPEREPGGTSTDERTIAGDAHELAEPALWLRADRAALALAYYRDVMVGEALALGKVPDRRTQYALSEIRDKVFRHRLEALVEQGIDDADDEARQGIEPKGGLLDWLLANAVFWVAPDGAVGAAVNEARPYRDIFSPWSRTELLVARDGTRSERERPTRLWAH